MRKLFTVSTDHRQQLRDLAIFLTSGSLDEVESAREGCPRRALPH
jgi:hypothetical protein